MTSIMVRLFAVPVFALCLLATHPVRASARPEFTRTSFFDHLDSKIAGKVSGRRLLLERFYVRMARLSSFAISCDLENEIGLPTRSSRLWQASSALRAQAEQTFGGLTRAENKFEDLRNQASLELHRWSGDVGADQTCEAETNEFVRLTDLTPASLEADLANGAYGTR